MILHFIKFVLVYGEEAKEGRMSEFSEILAMPLDEVLILAKQARRSNFSGMRKIRVVSGYLLGSRCGADCKFCGWNRNIAPCEDRIKLDRNALLAEMEEIYASKQDLEIINNTQQINSALLRELEEFSEICRYCIVGLNIGLSARLDDFKVLKELGFSYYVNDLETSPRIFGRMVTSHDWSEKLVAMELCKRVGLSLHSGFIFGLGEEDEDLELLFLKLKEFEVNGIVVNFFTPIHGVDLPSGLISPMEVLRRLSQLRIAFPNTSLVLGGGRRNYLGEGLMRVAFEIVDTIYTRSFLNHYNPYWLKEGEILEDLGF